MLQHYVKIAIRRLLKFKGYSIINLSGLALGLSAGILIMVYVLDELSFDKFHAKASRLYRVNTVFKGEQDGFIETSAWPVGDVIRREYPEVEAVLYSRSANNLMAHYEGKKLNEKSFYVSSEFFSMFSFPLLEGNAESCLAEPFSVVISRRMEEKYFKGEPALGKIMTFNDTLSFHVTGVMENVPSNSHMQFEMLMSFSTYEKLSDFSYNDGWGNFNVRNYVLLREGVDPESFMAKAGNIYMDKVGEQLKKWGMHARVAYEPFSDIYLRTKAGNGMGPLGSITTVYLLSGVALFVILLACINFINLATARSVYRAREVGVKKVVGSTRSRLVAQFLSESLVITVAALLISAAINALFLPLFNELLNKSYGLASLVNWKIGVGIVVLTGFITLCAGCYPAWVMSAFKPAEILKGKMNSGSQGIQLRRVLVVFQFMISVSLVAGTLIVVRQLEYMQKSDLGFTREEIFVMNTSRTKPIDGNAYDAFYNEVKSHSLVKEVSFSNALPAVSGWRGQWAYPGDGTAEDQVDMQYMAVDENYISTLGLTLVAGRNFDPSRKSDEDALIINETAVIAMGWETPENAIGKKITSPSQRPAGTVIGVVKDYHDWGLQNKIAPAAMDFDSKYSYLYAIRFQAGNTKALIESMGAIWNKYFPENDFNYSFLSETFAKQYTQEQRLARVFSVFSTITILIAIIGMFGLVSFMVNARTKEIGVRKVLGASVWSLTSLLSKEFVLLVVLANAVAVPLIIYLAQKWLAGFAFRMELSPVIFIVTTGITIMLTLLTTSLQTVKAAMGDPVNSLRYE